MPKFPREPLFHFFLLGLGLFLVHRWVAGPSRDTGESVVITEGRIGQIVAGYERAHQRAPVGRELDGLIEDAVREEILYREAMAMGLDQDDTIVRRRLRQKLEFISEDVAPLAEPTDAQLLGYLRAHPDKYLTEPEYSVSHAYLDPQKHGDRLDDDAASLLARLRRSIGNEQAPAGDSFLLPHRYDKIGTSELSRLFGAEFEKSLRTMPLKSWQGPVPSGYGVHLVFLHSRDDGRALALADARSVVRTDWMADQRRRANERFYEDLRKRYRVTIERPDNAADGAALALEGAR